MIVRVKKQDNFFVMDKTAVRDRRLSLSACGLLANLLAQFDGWIAREDEIVASHADGRTAVRSAMKELIVHGYMVRLKFVHKGRVVGWRTDTYECPALNPFFDPTRDEQPTQVTIPLDDEDYAAFKGDDGRAPQFDFPDVENATLIKNKDNKKEKELSAPAEPSAPTVQESPTTVEATAPPRPKPKAESKSYVNPDTGVSTEAIRVAYLDALEEWEPNAMTNHAEIGRWAKEIATRGFTPPDVAHALNTMKLDRFWAGRHLSLGALAKQLPAITAAAKKHAPAQAKARQNAPRNRMKNLGD
jgi:hypothetical protein